jgi:hypothetical protein
VRVDTKDIPTSLAALMMVILTVHQWKHGHRGWAACYAFLVILLVFVRFA